MSDELLKELLEAIQRRLTPLGGSLLNYPELVEAPPESAFSESAGVTISLPAIRIALQIRPLPHILLLTKLDFDANGIPILQPILWWIARVRRRLTVHQRADLYAVLISNAELAKPALQNWHARIEGDDRFCRKLVLGPAHNVSARDVADRFLDRTFLARPWSEVTTAPTRSLDPMDTTAARFAESSLLSLQRAKTWLSILASEIEEARDIGDRLLAATWGTDD